MARRPPPSPEERAARAAKMRALWADPVWAAAARRARARAVRRRLTPDMRRRMVEMMREGETASRIADELGVSEWAIAREAFRMVQATLRRGEGRT